MPDRGRGLAQPSCGVGVVRSFFQRKSHSAPAVRLLGLCPGPPLFICGKKNIFFHKPRHFFHHFQVGKMKKSKSFFHALKATLDRLADRLLVYALGLGNFLDALSENDVGINPAALDLR